MAMSPTIKLMAWGSWTIRQSGGWLKPVAHGERHLMIQPLGVIRNARPSATVTCGTERIGASHLSIVAKVFVPCHVAQSSIVRMSEARVVMMLVDSDSQTEVHKPGSASNSLHAWNPGVRCPRTGR